VILPHGPWSTNNLLNVGFGILHGERTAAQVNYALHAAMERLGLRSGISDVDDHDGRDDGTNRQSSDSAFC